MNKEDLNGLLDNIYELEGLVHLALAREDCPECLPGLIVRKAKCLVELVKPFEASAMTEKTEEIPVNEEISDSSLCQEDPVAENLTESDSPSDTADNNNDMVPDTPAGIADVVVEDVIPENESIEEISPAQQVSEEVAVTGEFEDSAFAQYTLPPEDDQVLAVSLSGNNKGADEKIVSMNETWRDESGSGIDNSVSGTSRSQLRETVAPDDIPVRKNVEPRGKLVFTINDRYRFKRDLFCNSDADFNTTLALVASMDSYDEAEDYFLGELQWNPQREEVLDFLEILKNYFK